MPESPFQIQVIKQKVLKLSAALVAAVSVLFSFTSCRTGPLIVPSYPSLGAAPFIIGLVALGVLVGLLFYNLFLAISTRESMFIYFSLIMVLLTVLQTFSTFEKFFFQLTYNRVTLITHLLFVTFLLFFEEFFAVSRHRKRLAKVNRISIYVIAGYALFYLGSKLMLPNAETYHAVITFIRELFVFYTNILFITNIVAALAWSKREALVILIAFIPPALLTSLNALNIFPFMRQAGQFTSLMMQYNQPIGLSLQAILFSLAMGNRYNRINVEREQSLSEARTLKQIDRDRTEFYMNLSHELRTPLTIILGTARQLRGEDSSDSTESLFGTSRLAVIERNSLRLLHLFSNMLQIGRPHDDELPAQHIPVNRYLEQIQADFQGAAAARQITLTSQPLPSSSQDRYLQINIDDLDTLVMNLAANALKYTAAGGTVTISASVPDEGGLLLQVADSGVGIPEGMEEQIFDRYRRLPAGRALSELGSGLGLAIVKEIIIRCHGRVSVESRQGAGSRFSLWFPEEMIVICGSPHAEKLFPSVLEVRQHDTVRRFTADLYAPVPSECFFENTEPAGSRPRLLVVEDNPDMCFYIRSILSEQYHVTSARSAREALAYLGAHQIDLIISDVMMPDIDGHEFLQLLMQKLPDKRAPLIFLTARDSVEEKIQSLREGAVEYLTKPFDPQELIVLVETILTREREVLHKHIELIRQGLDTLLNEMAASPSGKRDQLDLKAQGVESGLTKRESEIFQLIITGRSDKEIARELNISVRTVSNHNRSIYAKFRVESRVELLARVFSRQSR
jgi:signal transduction histidine kinase/DNA-binding NarL/FixJ family response regulator